MSSMSVKPFDEDPIRPNLEGRGDDGFEKPDELIEGLELIAYIIML
jgi:hypothetical protein